MSSSAPTAHHHACPDEPISARDWGWRNHRYVVVDGPLAGADAQTLRTALREQWDAGTSGRALQRIDWRRRAWSRVHRQHLDEHLARVVVEDRTLPAEPLDRAAERLLNSPDDDLPLRVVVGGGYVLMRFHHLIGDGGNGRALVSWIVRLATGARPTELPVSHGETRPYRAALRTTFGGRPLPVAPVRTAAGLLGREFLDVCAGRVPGRGAGPRAATPAEPRTTSVESVALLGSGAEDLRAWRRRHAPGCSSAMLLSALVWAALRENGVVPADLCPGIAIDLRSYLPRRTAVDGNFVTAVAVPAGTAVSPVALRDAVEEMRSSGVPLVLSAVRNGLAEARGVVRGRRTPPAAAHPLPAVAPAAEPQDTSLILSFVGRLRYHDGLEWLPGPRTHFEAASTSARGSLTASCSELRDGFRCCVTFDERGVPRERVRAALQDLAARPGELLSTVR